MPDITRRKAAPYIVNGFLFLLLLLLIVFSDRITASIREAMLLCATCVIPALFPFMILSDALLAAPQPQGKDHRALRWLMRRFGANASGLKVLFLSFLCGFPVGTKMVCDLYSQRRLSRRQAEHLLRFCNNAGPGFVMITVGGIRGALRDGILLYLIQIIAACVCGLLLAQRIHPDEILSEPIGDDSPPAFSLSASVRKSAAALLEITAFIAFFSMLCEILCAYSRSPFLRTAVASLLEITNGIRAGAALSHEHPLFSFCASAAAVNFSGLSVHLQASAFIRRTDLLPRGCLLAKMLQAAISLPLAALCYFMILC